MPCYQPTRVIMDGDQRIQFNKDWRWAQFRNGETQVNLPCRKCIGCNIATQRELAVRCYHEAQLHTTRFREVDTKITTEIPNSCVITLTYDQAHLPRNGCLDHSHFQNFMKRLRNHRTRRQLGNDKPIRYMMCGEYGGKTQRPHFHAIIFGETFDDRYTEQSLDGQVQQMSSLLDDLWSQPAPGTTVPTNIGRATVDTFTFAGASYVAGYVAKKLQSTTNSQRMGPYQTTTNARGDIRHIPISPEYRKVSTHPGLGADWILKPENMQRTYRDDCVKISNWTFNPPKYYDKLMERHRPDLMGDIRANRTDAWSKSSQDWSPERCSSAELIMLSSLQSRRDSL